MLSLGPNVLCFSFEANLLCYTATRCFIVCHKCKRSVDNFNEGYMMAWSGESDRQVQGSWQSHLAKKRADLSKSVEETLADSILAEDFLSGEEEGELVQGKRSAMIIPPKLSLQSRPIPVVRVEPKETASVVVVDARSTSSSVEVPQAGQKKRRLAGRTTKVHLQAVSKSEKKSNGKVAVEPGKVEESASAEVQVGVKKNARIEGLVRRTARGTLSGSGMFNQGQKEASIANAYITTTSVVVVTLVGDPGPVVVKYISLQPQLGFTVHLSAPAEVNSPFNYVVLMGELF